MRGGQVPYLTDEWQKAICHRNHLWKVFSRNKTDANYSLYKLLRNKCTSLRRKSIISYFRKKSLAQDQDPRHFWTTFSPFLHPCKSQQTNNILLRENERVITDKQSIANIFNNHFVKATSDIEEPKSNCGANFEDHPSISVILANLPGDASSNFDFTLCNTVIVEKCLQEI